MRLRDQYKLTIYLLTYLLTYSDVYLSACSCLSLGPLILSLFTILLGVSTKMQLSNCRTLCILLYFIRGYNCGHFSLLRLNCSKWQREGRLFWREHPHRFFDNDKYPAMGAWDAWRSVILEAGDVNWRQW